jgi:tRNA threonylcarbamoyladenosine biosynthesis protein TsaB
MPALILHLETTSTVCSVSLSSDLNILSIEEIGGGYYHAEKLHVFIQKVCRDANVSLSELQAVSVSSGPGSYTGLRIGMSSAKGLCHALNIPLIGISTLHALCYAARKNEEEKFYAPMLDARRMEVYFAIYDAELKVIVEPSALVVDEKSVKLFQEFEGLTFFGSGVEKCAPLLSPFGKILDTNTIGHSAKWLIEPAMVKFQNKDFLDLAYCEPEYLKDFFDPGKAQKE